MIFNVLKKPEEDYQAIGFIITKPLQLLIVLAIIDQIHSSHKNDLLIVDLFHNARQISERLKKAGAKNCSIYFVENINDAYRKAIKSRYKKLFIDSDVGLLKNLTLTRLKIFSPRTILSVYEEGIGTYRKDLYSGVKKLVVRMLGGGIFFGGNWTTRELYIYDTDGYTNPIRSKKIKIKKGIRSLLESRLYPLHEIFGAAEFQTKISNQPKTFKCVYIYLSSWHIDTETLDHLKEKDSTVIIKPHPHIKDVSQLKVSRNFLLAPAEIPAEMLLSIVAASYHEIVVFHHGSSTERYCQDDRITFKNIST